MAAITAISTFNMLRSLQELRLTRPAYPWTGTEVTPRPGNPIHRPEVAVQKMTEWAHPAPCGCTLPTVLWLFPLEEGCFMRRTLALAGCALSMLLVSGDPPSLPTPRCLRRSRRPLRPRSSTRLRRAFTEGYASDARRFLRSPSPSCPRPDVQAACLQSPGPRHPLRLRVHLRALVIQRRHHWRNWSHGHRARPARPAASRIAGIVSASARMAASASCASTAGRRYPLRRGRQRGVPRVPRRDLEAPEPSQSSDPPAHADVADGRSCSGRRHVRAFRSGAGHATR